MPIRSHLAGFVIVVCFAIAGCTTHTPHTDPLKNWKRVGSFSNTPVPEVIKQDARAYFQTLPPFERGLAQEEDLWVRYWENGTGQHAVEYKAPQDGEGWTYALIYDRENRRIQTMKYSTYSYSS